MILQEVGGIMTSAIQELIPKVEHFLDKTTVIFGESGTGKSCIITELLYILSKNIDQVIVISPTDLQNHTYDRGLVPLPCIHYSITPALLESIWERQGALAETYTRANNPEIIESLFNKIDNIAPIKNAIDGIQRKIETMENEMSSNEDKARLVEIKAQAVKMAAQIRKEHIIKHKHTLLDRATAEEKHTLKYINLNPRIVLIFDDCTDMLKLFKKDMIMQKLFFQGRHQFVTTIIACHTDLALPPDLKKNAFVSIFTEEGCARAYFERPSANLGREGRDRAANVIKQAFSQKHQKLVWIRGNKTYYKYTAELHDDFQFGSRHIRDYCDKCVISSRTDGSNRFTSLFN